VWQKTRRGIPKKVTKREKSTEQGILVTLSQRFAATR
jgi:hypothetical protein